MKEAFENATRKFIFPIENVSRIHRSAAGNYLAKIGLRKGRDYIRNSPFGNGYYIINKDVYSFRREADSLAFKLWIPATNVSVSTEGAYYYCPYIPLTFTVTIPSRV